MPLTDADSRGGRTSMAIAETTERLEARITPDQKDLFKRAASLRGVTLTDFVVSSAHEAAVKTLEAVHVIEFGRRDQKAFVEALLNPEPPNKRLIAAVKRHGAAAESRPRARRR
jgi:uncharacterized protein (DUF1778 family)